MRWPAHLHLALSGCVMTLMGPLRISKRGTYGTRCRRAALHPVNPEKLNWAQGQGLRAAKRPKRYSPTQEEARQQHLHLPHQLAAVDQAVRRRAGRLFSMTAVFLQPCRPAAEVHCGCHCSSIINPEQQLHLFVFACSKAEQSMCRQAQGAGC